MVTFSNWIQCTQPTACQPNLVKIRHDDATIGVYLHFQQHTTPGGPFNLTLGQRVRTGNKLGKCGKVGFASAEHVHFQVDGGTASSSGGVYGGGSGSGTQSTPFQVRASCDGRAEAPRQGRVYPGATKCGDATSGTPPSPTPGVLIIGSLSPTPTIPNGRRV